MIKIMKINKLATEQLQQKQGAVVASKVGESLEI